MATWPANGETDWNTKMLAFLAIEHNTDGTHSAAGLAAQVVNTQTGAMATGETTIPYDDTVPTKTEGDEYMTLAITPTDSNNKLKIEVVLFFSGGGSDKKVVALFQDATATALAAGFVVSLSEKPGVISFTHYMTAGTTSSTTFKIRAGGQSGAFTFNGQGGSRKMGGVIPSSITITEIIV